jgi:hypothetical protein
MSVGVKSNSSLKNLLEVPLNNNNKYKIFEKNIVDSQSSTSNLNASRTSKNSYY